MKRTLLSLLLVFILSLLGCTQQPTSDNSLAEPTESAPQSLTIADFSFQAPNDWTYQDLGIATLSTPTGYLTYEVAADLIETQANDQFIDDVLLGVSLLYTDYKLLSGPTRQAFGDLNGFTYTFQYSQDDQLVQATAASLFTTSGMLTFTLFNTDPSQSYQNDFDAILASLQPTK